MHAQWEQNIYGLAFSSKVYELSFNKVLLRGLKLNWRRIDGIDSSYLSKLNFVKGQ